MSIYSPHININTGKVSSNLYEVYGDSRKIKKKVEFCIAGNNIGIDGVPTKGIEHNFTMSLNRSEAKIICEFLKNFPDMEHIASIDIYI